MLPSVIVVFAFLALELYFLPTYLAFRKGKRDRIAIFVINLFGGALFGIGWIVALVWAVKYEEPSQDQVEQAHSSWRIWQIITAVAFFGALLIVNIGGVADSLSRPFRDPQPQQVQIIDGPDYLASKQAASSRFAKVSILGFRPGETARDVGIHAANLGITTAGDCDNRRNGEGVDREYVDCEFSSESNQSLGASFYHSRLQRVEYRFPIGTYSGVVKRIEQTLGNSNAVTDPHDPSLVISQVWNGSGFNVSAIKTADGTSGVVSIIFEPTRIGTQ